MDEIKIIGISGSPHINGNTAKLVNRVLDGCKARGAKVEFISIGNKKILPCKACYECVEKGTCILEDDLNKIRDKMLGADGIVIGSPTYNRGITGQLKVFFDRLWLDIHKETFLRKYAVYVNTCAFSTGYSMKMLKELCIALGYTIVGGIRSEVGKFNNTVDNDIGAQKRAFEMGVKLVDAIQYKKSYFLEDVIRKYYIRPILKKVDVFLSEK